MDAISVDDDRLIQESFVEKFLNRFCRFDDGLVDEVHFFHLSRAKDQRDAKNRPSRSRWLERLASGSCRVRWRVGISVFGGRTTNIVLSGGLTVSLFDGYYWFDFSILGVEASCADDVRGGDQFLSCRSWRYWHEPAA